MSLLTVMGLDKWSNFIMAKINKLKNDSETNLQSLNSTLTNKINVAEAIARGRHRAIVFDTLEALDSYLSIADNTSQLEIGDNFYIIDVATPDYWWDGNTRQELEGSKIDIYNTPIRKIPVANNDINVKSGEIFTATCGTSNVFTINNPMLYKGFKLLLTGGTLNSQLFAEYTTHWILSSEVTDYVPANVNILVCEIRSDNNIYVFWGE